MSFGAALKSDWFIGTILTLLFIIAFQLQSAPFKKIENLIYDIQASQTIQHVDDRIVILNIDNASRQQSGLSPQGAIASAISKLTTANARLIGIHTILNKPEESTGINNTASISTSLINAIRNSGNSLLAMQFNTGPTDINNKQVLPKHLQRTTLKHIHPTSDNAIIASRITAPYKQVAQSAAGVGHISNITDHDGILRSEALIIAYGNHYFPSLTLMLAAHALNVATDDIRIKAGKYIELGPLDIHTDIKSRIYPAFFQNDTKSPFPIYTFKQLHEGILSNSIFSDKIILIGNASHHSNNTFSTPGHTNMTRVEYSAHVLQSILHKKTFQHPSWTKTIELALLFIIGLYLTYFLSRLKTRTALLISSLVFIILISTDLILLHYYSLWLQTISAALLLLIGHVLIASKQIFKATPRLKKPATNIHETNKMLGVSFQNQGMLDQAFEKFMACPVDDEMLEAFDKLAQAFERKRQFKQAKDIYEHIANHDPIYKDIQTRINTAKISENNSLHKDANATLSSLLVSKDHSPTLGRYEIISELGKGAMGTVYLGKDPKINRKVAIKTMALSQEFKPEELEEVKNKFFHEAEIAGMLNHPNIVTIFDAGDEHDLAYIAMEFLDGIDLSPYTKNGKLLPLATTLKIVGKVSEALQYAHDHGVIHRDIKPANIMILKNKTVKVTDFGIAHIIESSKTKAGVVLGTPSYMSPEQLSGKTLDGRSDLFSLGVMLYELVSGTRPFRAESISKLMYKIAKQPHIDVREHNSDIPDSTRLLINDLLTKKADQRIKTANEVLTRITLCLRELNSRGEKQ